MKNNNVDLKHTIKGDHRFNTLGKIKDQPLAKEDEKQHANCYVIEDGTRFEVNELLMRLKKFDKKKKQLVFIVAAGHGTMNCAQQLYFTNKYSPKEGYDTVNLEGLIREAAQKCPELYFITLLACERTN